MIEYQIFKEKVVEVGRRPRERYVIEKRVEGKFMGSIANENLNRLAEDCKKDPIVWYNGQLDEARFTTVSGLEMLNEPPKTTKVRRPVEFDWLEIFCSSCKK